MEESCVCLYVEWVLVGRELERNLLGRGGGEIEQNRKRGEIEKKRKN
jgi:hypothetical protein